MILNAAVRQADQRFLEATLPLMDDEALERTRSVRMTPRARTQLGGLLGEP